MDDCNFLFIWNLVSTEVAFHPPPSCARALWKGEISELVLSLGVTLDTSGAASALTLPLRPRGAGARCLCFFFQTLDVCAQL